MSEDMNKQMKTKHIPVLSCFFGYDPIILGNPNPSVLTPIFFYYKSVLVSPVRQRPLSSQDPFFLALSKGAWYRGLDQ